MKEEIIQELSWNKMDGLIPAIIQNHDTLQILMLGFMNQEALEKTLSTGEVTFYSRSKKRLWTKGETSGNKLNLIKIEPDCDKDTLLISVRPVGSTCHEGTTSCFGNGTKLSLGFLNTLSHIIDMRYQKRPEGSYTTKLFNKGLDRIAQKLGEETIETIIASKNENFDSFQEEAADLLYHFMVLLREKDLGLSEVVECLRKRHASAKNTH